MSVAVPENPAASAAVRLAESSPLPAKDASLDSVLHLNTADPGSLSLLEGG